MFSEGQMIVVNTDIPQHNIQVGDIGVIVYLYENSCAAEIEFVTGDGKTVSVVTIPVSDIRTMASGEILHVRSIRIA